MFFVLLYRWFPSILQAMTIVRPETVVRWDRAGFRRYCRKSRARGGRPPIQAGVARSDPADERRERALGSAAAFTASCLSSALKSRSLAWLNTWAERGPPSQGWGTFLRNHALEIVAIDLFVAPTLGFDSLCLRHRPSGPESARLDQRHRQSNGRMGRPPDHRGLPLE